MRPDAPLALSQLALLGAHELDAARASVSRRSPRRRVRPHARVHRRRDEHRPAVRERRLGEDVVGEAVRELRERVRRARRDDEQVGTRRGADRRPPAAAAARARWNVSARPRSAARRGVTSGHDLVPGLHEQPGQLARLVRGDPAGHPEEDLAHTRIVPPINPSQPLPLPTPTHRRAAEAAVSFLRTLPAVDAVLVVGSAARRPDANDLDLCALVADAGDAEAVERRFAEFASSSVELQALTLLGPFVECDLHAPRRRLLPRSARLDERARALRARRRKRGRLQRRALGAERPLPLAPRSAGCRTTATSCVLIAWLRVVCTA